jgi:hypothetical protein
MRAMNTFRSIDFDMVYGSGDIAPRKSIIQYTRKGAIASNQEWKLVGKSVRPVVTVSVDSITSIIVYLHVYLQTERFALLPIHD